MWYVSLLTRPQNSVNDKVSYHPPGSRHLLAVEQHGCAAERLVSQFDFDAEFFPSARRHPGDLNPGEDRGRAVPDPPMML